MNHGRIALAAILLPLLLAGCGGSKERDDGRLPVTVSIAPQKWLLRQIGGDRVRVTVLLSGADDPHSFAPADAQITDVLRSRIYFRIGVPFETGRWSRGIGSSGRVRIVDMHAGIERHAMAHEQGHAGHEDHADESGVDPHVWLSPGLLKLQARNAAEALADADPDHRADYQRNLAELEGRLDRLDRDLSAILDPLAGGSFVVYHPAWGYFAEAYGLRQVAVEIEGKEPTDAELTGLRAELSHLGARVIFVQPQFAGRGPEVIARAVGGRTATLDPLAEDVEANLRSAAEAIAAAIGGGERP